MTEDVSCSIYFYLNPVKSSLKLGDVLHQTVQSVRMGFTGLGVDPSCLMTSLTLLLLPGDTQMLGLLKVKGDNEQD